MRSSGPVTGWRCVGQPQPQEPHWQFVSYDGIQVLSRTASELAGDTPVVTAGAELRVGPNPIRDRAQFAFTTAEAADVTLAVYDALGREVAMVLDRRLEAGAHSVAFDAAQVPAGTYVYRLRVGETVETGRMTVIR